MANGPVTEMELLFNGFPVAWNVLGRSSAFIRLNACFVGLVSWPVGLVEKRMSLGEAADEAAFSLGWRSATAGALGGGPGPWADSSGGGGGGGG